MQLKTAQPEPNMTVDVVERGGGLKFSRFLVVFLENFGKSYAGAAKVLVLPSTEDSGSPAVIGHKFCNFSKSP